MAEITEVFGGPFGEVKDGYHRQEVLVSVKEGTALYEELRWLSERMRWDFERTVELAVMLDIEGHIIQNIKKMRRSLDNEL